MPESSPAFVHHLRLALRIEVLRHLAHDAHHLALPGLQQGGILFDEVKKVFLGFCRKALRRTLAGSGLGAARQRAPHVVDLLLLVVLAFRLLADFLRQRTLLRTAVAVDPVVHERVARIEQFFNGFLAMTFLAAADVVPRIDQVIDDGRRIGPHPEQVVALEKTVVPVSRMGNHQRLHGHGVFFHEVGNARIRVDDDFIRQAHVTSTVIFFRQDELLAVGPVTVDHRHADAGIGVHHLLGRDDLELDRIRIELERTGSTGNFSVVPLDKVEGPVRGTGQGLCGASQ